MSSSPSSHEFGALRSSLGRARGLGSAKTGTHHWITQRMTALANIPLVIWAIMSIVSFVGSDASYQTFVAWVAMPINAALLILFVVSTFYHAALGIQVVIEDYIHHKLVNILALVGVKLVFFACGAVCVLSVLSLAL